MRFSVMVARASSGGNSGSRNELKIKQEGDDRFYTTEDKWLDMYNNKERLNNWVPVGKKREAVMTSLDFKKYKDFGIEVECLHASPLWLAANAIRYSHDNHHLSDSEAIYETPYGGLITTVCGEKDKALIRRVGCKMKHESVLEMIDFTFSIHGVSRALLQELSRHRLASLTVQSSRYVLHKLLKDEEPFTYMYVEDGEPVISTVDGAFERARKYIMYVGDGYIDGCNIMTLERLRKGVAKGTSNDKLKYLIPECFRTKLEYKINLRSLRNLLELRTSKDALWEFRLLCSALIDAIPLEYHYLLEDVIKFEEFAPTS